MKDAGASLVARVCGPPRLAHRASASGLGVAEDVRMPRDELGGHAPSCRLEVAASVFLEKSERKYALVEEVADLVEQLRVVAGERRIRDLVGLFDRVRDDRARRLLTVPRALAAEALGQRLQLDERIRERQLIALSSRWSSSPCIDPASACSRPGTGSSSRCSNSSPGSTRRRRSPPSASSEQRLPDLRGDFLLGSRRLGLHGAERLDHEPGLVLRRVEERLHHLAGGRGERRRVEDRDRLALRNVALPQFSPLDPSRSASRACTRSCRCRSASCW